MLTWSEHILRPDGDGERARLTGQAVDRNIVEGQRLLSALADLGQGLAAHRRIVACRAGDIRDGVRLGRNGWQRRAVGDYGAQIGVDVVETVQGRRSGSGGVDQGKPGGPPVEGLVTWTLGNGELDVGCAPPGTHGGDLQPGALSEKGARDSERHGLAVDQVLAGGLAHGEREVGVGVVVWRRVRPCGNRTKKPREDDRQSTHQSQHDEQRANAAPSRGARLRRGQVHGFRCAVLIARSCSISCVVVIFQLSRGTRLPSPPVSLLGAFAPWLHAFVCVSTLSFDRQDDDRKGKDDQQGEQRHPRARRQIAPYQRSGIGGLRGRRHGLGGLVWRRPGCRISPAPAGGRSTAAGHLGGGGGMRTGGYQMQPLQCPGGGGTCGRCSGCVADGGQRGWRRTSYRGSR